MRAKGDRFEDEVYARLKDAFAARKFGLDPAKAVYRRKPKYFSPDRQSHIEFDISIEMRVQPKTPPFITLVFECKNYAGAIPVDDVEEFKAKLDQCFGKNVKGVLMVRGALQRSALTYALARGICVARILSEDSIQIVSYDIAASDEEWKQGVVDLRASMLGSVREIMIDPNYVVWTHPFGWSEFYASAGETDYISLTEFLASFLVTVC